MSTLAQYRLAYGKWHTTPALLTEVDFACLQEFGSDGECARARADRVRALPPAGEPAPRPSRGERDAEAVAAAVAAAVGPFVLTQMAALRAEHEVQLQLRDMRIETLERSIANCEHRCVELEAQVLEKAGV